MANASRLEVVKMGLVIVLLILAAVLGWLALLVTGLKLLLVFAVVFMLISLFTAGRSYRSYHRGSGL
jgi:hypothetical protein